MKRKLIALVLSLLMMLYLLPINVFAINYFSVPIDSYDSFRNATYKKGYDIDGSWGYQCWDGAALFWQQLGMWLETGDGNAKGCWLLKKEVNAGNKFDLIYNLSDVKRGDVVVLSYGETGHIAFADADYSGSGFLVLYGQNQNYSGEPFNTYNWKMATFLGAFRYKGWHSHSHVFNQKNTEARYLKSAATCTANAVYYYSCSCGEKGSSTFSSGKALGHSFTSKNTDEKYLKSKASCTSPATYYYSCERCGTVGTKTFTEGKATGHSYNAASYSATSTKAAYTEYTCTGCGHSYQENGIWTTIKPEVDAVEYKVQYRYRVKSTKVQNASDPVPVGWTWESSDWESTGTKSYYYFIRPAGFNSDDFSSYAASPLSPYTKSDSKREVSGAKHNTYIYWHWAFPISYGVAGNCYIGRNRGATVSGNPSYGAATVWEAFESSTDIRWQTNSDGTARVSGHSNYSYNWFVTETFIQDYTDFVKKDQYFKWSSWSEWQDVKVTGNNDREVETRTVYHTYCTPDDLKIVAPTIYAQNDDLTGKPKLTWNAVNGAVKYQVYRLNKDSSSFYVKLATISGTDYTDTLAVEGSKYYYKVRSVTANGYTSNYSEAKPAECYSPGYISNPKIAFIERLYKVCLGRACSEDEIAFYKWMLTDQGMTGVEAAYNFVFSDEFKLLSYCERHYTIALYEAFMGREPTEEEISHWIWKIQQGSTREDVFNTFATSAEFGAVCTKAGITQGGALNLEGQSTHAGGYCTVEGCHQTQGLADFSVRLYETCLGRTPVEDEINAWHYNLNSGLYTAKTAAYAFLFSEEFIGQGYDDETFVTRLYQALMGRDPAQEEVAFWCWMLADQGLTREGVFNQFIDSDEFKLICSGFNVVCK